MADPTEDAWARTLFTHEDVEVVKDVTKDPKSKSARGMCPTSPDDGRHWWDLGAVGEQSSERYDCRWCHVRIYD